MSLKIVAHTADAKKRKEAIAHASPSTLLLGPMTKKPFIGMAFV